MCSTNNVVNLSYVGANDVVGYAARNTPIVALKGVPKAHIESTMNAGGVPALYRITEPIFLY